MLKLLSPSDSARALPLLEAQYREHHLEMGGARLRAALRALLRGRGVVLLASRGGRDLGVAVLSFTWTLEHGGKVAWLDEMYVLPDARGRGTGLALLRRALREARAAGCAAVE